MIRLSAFADEISPNLQEQIDVLLSENIHYIDLRSVDGVNVLDLSTEQISNIQTILRKHHIKVAAIGSPIGKVPVDISFDTYMEKFKHALTLAQTFETRYIRLFSFYPPASTQTDAVDPATYRNTVLHFLKAMTHQAQAANIILLHENEKQIYGDTISRNVDLLESINNPHFRAILDPANYLECQQEPYPTAYDTIKPWLEYIHVKDVNAQGKLVVAGQGEGRWVELLQRLRQDNYDGFLTLEPHLAIAGQFSGVSGPDLFRQASQALQSLLKAMKWSYS